MPRGAWYLGIDAEVYRPRPGVAPGAWHLGRGPAGAPLVLLEHVPEIEDLPGTPLVLLEHVPANERPGIRRPSSTCVG